jgi:large subunit ribosomal protein L23
MQNQSAILSPIITEKAMKASDSGKYSFIVAEETSKIAIKKAVKSLFGANVIQVRTINVKGKRIRVGKRRTEIAKSAWKKAIIKLKKGEKITMLEPGSTDDKKAKKK